MMYYFVNNTGQQQGPVPASDLPKYGVTPQTKVWKEGMANWQPAGSVAELTRVFTTAPVAPPVVTPMPPVAPPSPPVEKKGGALKYVLLGIGGVILVFFAIYVGIGSTGKITMATPKITMTTNEDVSQIELNIGGSGNLKIDWGDGSKEMLTLEPETMSELKYGGPVRHRYSKAAKREIVISEGDIRVLGCARNSLTSLDVSKYPTLEMLNCHANQLTSLDVSNNTALRELGCGMNQLTSLNVSNNRVLKVLECVDNQLASLDVSNNTALEKLHCHQNQLTSLDVSKNKALWSLNYDENKTKLRR